MAAVETVLDAARAAGRPSLVGYVTGGVRPDWPELVAAIAEAGADAVEIGLPFSDPMIDGPVIQEASARAIASGATTESILAELRESGLGAAGLAASGRGAARLDAAGLGAPDLGAAGLGAAGLGAPGPGTSGLAATVPTPAGRPGVPLIAMAYANHAYRAGLTRYLAMLADAGFSGVIIPDLPVAESAAYRAAAEATGLDATLMVTPATPEPQVRAIAGATRGFLYVMSIMNTTGPARLNGADSGYALADRARALSPRPTLIGFGIDGPDRAAAAARHADGVIVGSALTRPVLDGQTPAQVGAAVAAIRQAIDQAVNQAVNQPVDPAIDGARS
jgi:tryptophan synthase alpha chain